MKATKLKNSTELAVGPRQIRPARSGALVSELGMEVEVNHQRVKVLNISETGIAVQGDVQVPLGAELPIQILVGGNKQIYSGNAKCVWINTDSEIPLSGFAFTSQFLGRNLIQGMEKINFLYSKTEEQDDDLQLVPTEFKVFVLEFKRYLDELKKCLDAVEASIQVESPDVKKSYETAIALTVEEKILRRLKNFNLELNRLLEFLTDKKVRAQAIALFRIELGPYLTTSPFSKRALLKPLGYAGDHEMMSQIYRDSYEGVSLFDKMIHKYSINESSSNSVKYRRRFFKKIILEKLQHGGEVKIASIASGPAAEIHDVVESVDPALVKNLKVVLVDQDVEALLSAKRSIAEVALRRNMPVQVDFLAISVKELLEGTPIVSRLAHKFDVIYSAGLFDYLTQPTAKMFALALLDYVEVGGRFIIGNFHPSNPTKAISEFAVDWRLIHRSEAEMLELVPDHLVSKKELFFDEGKIEIFLDIIK